MKNLTDFRKTVETGVDPRLHLTFPIETYIRRTPCIERTLQHSPRVSD